MTIIIPPLPDIWWCEACAGTGNIFRQLPPERRIGFDINPRDSGELGIIQADFRTQLLDPANTWGVLTNAPFRKMPGDTKGGAEVLFAWAAAQRAVVFIGLIAPTWFRRAKVVNSLDPYFHLVHSEELPTDSFTRDGQVKWCPAIFQVWVRRDYRRELIPIIDTHEDWVWLPARRMTEADAWMLNWGIACGEIKPPDKLGRINDPNNHWFIKEIRPGTLDRLQQIKWGEVAHPTTATPRLHKDEVVAAYIAAYGNSDSPEVSAGNAGSAVEPAQPAAVVPLVIPVVPPAAVGVEHLVIVSGDGGAWQVMRGDRAVSDRYKTHAEAARAGRRLAKKYGLPLTGDRASPP
jgi:hypothetical protein